ncbi:MAG: Fic family protein, partial [Pseudohongiellaceae bacterium]
MEGTLIQTFPLYQQLPPGIAKAVFMQFMVAECHPFDDGNGRMARIMMNAELVSAEQHKIIVPTVHRESYLNGLRQATGSG